jgi:hypothetical protein
MKHSLTTFACLLTMSLSAQTGFVEFPYNPDSDNDDMIGTEDLLGLLSLYGSEFSEEGLYLSTDSTDALYHTGNMHFYQCYKSCNDLPGNWSMATRNKLYKHDLASLTGPVCWIQNDLHNVQIAVTQYLRVTIGSSTSQTGGIEVVTYTQTGQCYCAAHERPNVEYSYCRGEYATDPFFQACAEEKVEDGWYPLGGIEVDPGQDPHQAFWRWAE